MPKTRKIQLSFAGGEIDTQMYGRIDAQQYQSGLATCKNWMVDPRGGLRRRPGFQRVASSLDSTKKSRLIPFTYSVDQQLAIELTDQKIRFHSDGETIVWANLKKFSRLTDQTANTITFDEPHGFTQGEHIAFYARLTPGGGGNPLTDPLSTLPPPFNVYRFRPAGTTLGWKVDVVDTHKIRVLDPTDDSVESITGNGTANFDLYAFSTGTDQGKVGPARKYKRRFFGSDGEKINMFRPDSSSDYCLKFGENPTAGGEYLRDDWQQGECVQIMYRDTSNASLFSALPGIPTKLYVDYTANGTASCNSFQFGLRTQREFVGTAKDDNAETYVSAEDIVSAFDNSGYGQLYGSDRGIWITQFHEEGELLYLDYSAAAVLTSSIGIWASTGVRQRVYRVDTEFLSEASNSTTTFDVLVANNCTQVEGDGAFSVASPFLEAELFDIEYDQSGDVVTFTHPNHPPQDLKRFGSVNWTMGPVEFNPILLPPTNIGGTSDRGQAYACSLGYQNASASLATVLTLRDQDSFFPFVIGDTVFIANTTISSTNITNFFGSDGVDRYFTVAESASQPTDASGFNQITLRDSTGRLVEHSIHSSSSGVSADFIVTSADVLVYYSVADAETQQKYKVTAVDSRGQESLGSAEKTFDNVLSVPGASNTITFDAVFNARSYNVYKEINGTFGFIGQVDHKAGSTSYSFEDDNIGPDLSQTLLIPDADVQAAFQPRAAARFEQRRCFGGSDALPRTLFMSRSGTESSFSYRFPVQPDDRISVDLASREAHVIRHIVPVQDLLLMTQQGEFRVTAINSDAITPSTIAIRQQSYVGSNTVHPQVVNNSVVFCAARGGHARQVSFSAEMQGYLTGDLSLRAAHLFDGFTLNDLAYSKAPIPVLWFVSSSGKLLCLTYIPEERVMAWHQHETDGTIESICSLSEGSYDNLYAVVLRGSNRSIERIKQVRDETLTDSVYLDASVIKDGTYSGTAKVAVESSGLFQEGDTVTIKSFDSTGDTATPGLFSSEDAGSAIEFTSGTTKYRVTLDTYVSATEFTGKLLSNFPADLANTPTSTWAFARKTFSGFSHLASQTISVLVDGAKTESVTVSAAGEVVLSDYAVKICGGLSYTSQAKTLPMSLEIEAGAQGRTKNINQVSIRVEDCGALKVGMDEADLKSVSELKDTELKTGEFRTHVPSTWDEESHIVVEATGAAPASLLNITTQVSIGD